MIKIPKDVYEVINNKYEGFDKMYYGYIREGCTTKQAFENCIDRIHTYFPKYTPYSDWHSYHNSKNRRTRKMLLKNKRN